MYVFDYLRFNFVMRLAIKAQIRTNLEKR